MQKLKKYLFEFWDEDFHFAYYLTVAIFIIVCIAINYLYFPVIYGESGTIESKIIYSFFRTRSIWLAPIYALFYAFPYYTTTLIHYFYYRDASFIKKPEFWSKSLLAILLMAMDCNSHLYYDIAEYFRDLPEYNWIKKCLATLTNYLYIGLPLFLFWYFYDKKRAEQGNSFYGLTLKNFDFKPYGIIVLIILPFLFIASLQPQFLNYYPTLKMHALENFRWFPKSLAFSLYETIYGFFYTWTEVMMRGFLVIGMAAIMGRSAVVPMASMYAFRHFAKPWGETVSSVIGGYILGAFALKSRNVVGGIILHATIAVGMDVFAFIQLYLVNK